MARRTTKRFLLPCIQPEPESPVFCRALAACSKEFPAHLSNVSRIPPPPLECSKAASAPVAVPQSACAPRILIQQARAKTELSSQNKGSCAYAARRQNGFDARSLSAPCETKRHFAARRRGLRGSGLSSSRTARLRTGRILSTSANRARRSVLRSSLPLRSASQTLRAKTLPCAFPFP